MHNEALDEVPEQSAKWQEVHARAMRRFDQAVLPQLEIRQLALQARRFVTVPGAMWEGDWGVLFENAPRLEVDKITPGLRKIENDYRQNRIVPDFRPSGGDSDDQSAATLDGLHRADSYHYKAQQARDNAFSEGLKGGFGAYRLTNELAQPDDADSDEQRINPGMIIVDADQCVFFDGDSKTYDKSDARFAFIITSHTLDAFEELYPGHTQSWPDPTLIRTYDWFAPMQVRICEYYEVSIEPQKKYTFTQVLTGAVESAWASDIDANEIAEMKDTGYVVTSKNVNRRRIRKWLMTGAEILKDQGFIAGSRIPIVPFYGKRDFVDGIERFTGYVQSKMDSQRLYNTKVSKLAEGDALAPREIPILAAEQMTPSLAVAWSRQNIDRAAYALINPLLDPVTGQIVSAGPVGSIAPMTLPPVTASLLQIASNDLMEDAQDSAEQVKSNTSADAMEIAAARVDAKSGIYLDNFRQSVQCEGEIYLSMAPDVYFEQGRDVETMDEDGGDATAQLNQMITSADGKTSIINNFGQGKYKAIASVTEATTTRRDKTVRSALNIAEAATRVGDQQLARAALITAVMNQEGEGTADMQAYARSIALEIGLVKPNEDEQRAADQQAQASQPDPNIALVEGQANALNASAELDKARIEKTIAEVALTKAKTLETLHDAHQSAAPQMLNNDNRPLIRLGSETMQ